MLDIRDGHKLTAAQREAVTVLYLRLPDPAPHVSARKATDGTRMCEVRVNHQIFARIGTTGKLYL